MRPTASGVTGTLLRLAAGLLTLVGLGAALVVVSADRSDAADLSRFDPGYIISDAVFFNAGAMNAAQIQSFLDVKGAACVPAAGNTCLKNYSENTATRAATTRCAQYNGGAGESAATIISKVASACGINPRVLIVTLQKEQGLVTASTGKPASTYQKAMGYGCPDTAACDSLYYGFFNQVYSAASQFQNYAQNPTKYAHRVGTVAVRYHPNLACGSSAVTIRNQATAGLYNYTPYQPNPAALAAGYGVGDACSSYGNRNFWNYFSDWFGSPTGGSPFGFVDSVDVLGQTVTVTGWAIDPDTNASIAVEASVAGTSVRATASGSRPDVDAAYGRGALHGYSVAITAPPGAQSVCITALDDVGAASPTVLGCRSVVVPHPVAAILDSVTTDVTGITLTGWAFDPDSFSTSVPVVVTVDGSPTTVSANTSRPDIDQIFGSGPNHGFSTHVPAGLGDHQVCVTAKKPAPGVDRSLGCRTVTVRNQDPTGFVDTLTGTPTGINLSGWVLDPDSTDPVTLHIYVDGTPTILSAAAPRPDIDAIFGKGPNHGFSTTIAASTGTHNVCIYAINTPSGNNPTLACRTVTVRNQDPTGFVDTLTGTPTGINLSGWVLDPDSTDPVTLHIYVDGTPTILSAAAPRPDIDAIFGKGPNHGFSTTIAASTGTHNVCIYAINTPSGNNPTLACRTVTVRNQDPTGFVDTLTGTPTGINLSGWVLDPDSTDPVTLHIYVDGTPTILSAAAPRPDIDAIFGKGPNHGFSTTIAASTGTHNVCIYAINTPSGNNPTLACRTVTV